MTCLLLFLVSISESDHLSTINKWQQSNITSHLAATHFYPFSYLLWSCISFRNTFTCQMVSTEPYCSFEWQKSRVSRVNPMYFILIFTLTTLLPPNFLISLSVLNSWLHTHRRSRSGPDFYTWYRYWTSCLSGFMFRWPQMCFIWHLFYFEVSAALPYDTLSFHKWGCGCQCLQCLTATLFSRMETWTL